jgi:hypothetical protein
MFQRFSTVIASAAIALLASAPTAGAQATKTEMKAPASREVTVTGTVVDVSCKFGQGLTGEDHRMCAQVCSDRAIPLAILTADGKLYIPTSAAMPGDAQNDRLKEFAERKVTVKGKAFEAGGAQAIQISSVVAAR